MLYIALSSNCLKLPYIVSVPKLACMSLIRASMPILEQILYKVITSSLIRLQIPVPLSVALQHRKTAVPADCTGRNTRTYDHLHHLSFVS